MITIGELVNNYIKNHPFIEQAAGEGLINYSSLARQIKPEIEKELMKRIEVSAVAMALRRAAKNIKQKRKEYPIIHAEEIILRSGITEFTFAKSATIASNVAIFLHSIAKENTCFSTVTQGVFEVAVIMSTQFEGKAKKIFQSEKIKSYKTGISAITLRLPENNLVVPGVYHRFLHNLAWENINIVDTVSTFTEITILLAESEVERAFRLLKE